MEEIWKDINELGDYYQISNFGRTRRKARWVNSITGVDGKRKLRDKFATQQDNGNGYLQLYVCINSVRKMLYIHRLVAQYFLPHSDKNFVNHKDGNKKNNHASNLEWVTPAENLRHASEMGLMACGERTKNSKLTTTQIIAIRRLYSINPKFNRTKVAKKVGVADSTIHKIINGQRWKHSLN